MNDHDDASRNDINQIKDAFKRAWQSGNHRPEIADFLEELEASQKEDVLRELVALDIMYRLQTGEEVDSNIYSPLGESAVAFAEETKKTPADQFATIAGEPSAAISQSGWHQGSLDKVKHLIADRYRLIKQIGKGGMGTVWMAQQEKPVRRRVAVKVINNTLGCGEAIARFEAERQALAMMNHPNIAKVLDAGTTADGRPFFVMELVKGVPITNYCKDRHLSNRKRLELMITVCEAVQHAHQKGIIHRDLKPTNILVTVQGDHPVPKVIDFGLAKALESGTRLTDKTIITEYGRVVGTLQYMSPEQAGSNELDIDTRTDVYSIGVLLYQLLTDIIPLEKETLSGKYLMQIVELICESEILRPSVCLARNREALLESSRLRQTEPNQLIRSLQGELDWIVLKALEKDRTNRYQTANGVAMDIQRYLNNEPIAARPPSNTYLLKKLLKKYQGLAISVAVAAALLVIATIVSAYFAIDANKARAKAETARQLADLEKKNAQVLKTKADDAADEAEAAEELARKQFGVFIKSFASTNLLEGAKKDMSAVDVLQEAQRNLKLDLSDDPLGQASMLHEIGKAYRGRSRIDLAVDALTQAYELRNDTLGPGDESTNDSLIELAKARMENAKNGVAKERVPIYLQETLAMMEDACTGHSKILPADDLKLLVARKDLGTAYLFAFKELRKLGNSRQDYVDNAIDVLSQTYEIQKQKLGSDNEIVLTTLTNLTNALLKGGNVETAIVMSGQAIDGWSRLYNKATNDVEKRKLLARRSNARNNYGEALHQKGRLDQAIGVYLEALEEKEVAFGIGHSIWFNTVRGLLDCYVEADQLDNARDFLESTTAKVEQREINFDKESVKAEIHRIGQEAMQKHAIDE